MSKLRRASHPFAISSPSPKRTSSFGASRGSDLGHIHRCDRACSEQSAASCAACCATAQNTLPEVPTSPLQETSPVSARAAAGQGWGYNVEWDNSSRPGTANSNIPALPPMPGPCSMRFKSTSNTMLLQSRISRICISVWRFACYEWMGFAFDEKMEKPTNLYMRMDTRANSPDTHPFDTCLLPLGPSAAMVCTCLCQ